MKKVLSATGFASFLVILVFLSLCASPGYAQSLEGTSISGRILSTDQAAPISGAIVKAADIKSKKIYESNPTAKNGYYEISGLESGTYDIAVQVDDGLYLVNKLLNLGTDQSHTLSLTLKENPAASQEGEEKTQEEEEGEKKKEEGEVVEEGGEEGEETITPEDQEEEEEALGFWDNPLTATGAFIGIALVTSWGVDELTDEEKRASPF
jgi:hypothetical protein